MAKEADIQETLQREGLPSGVRRTEPHYCPDPGRPLGCGPEELAVWTFTCLDAFSSRASVQLSLANQWDS